MSKLVLVAFGSNLPDRSGRSSLDLCRWAVDALAARPGLTLRAVSDWYRTAPVPASDQPDYVNGVARYDTDVDSGLDPVVLLATLHALEAEAGRTRSLPNAARVLDLDLLACGDQVADTPALRLPHPRLHERAFVLHPLCDVAPGWRHPLLGHTAAELRDALPSQRVDRLSL